MSRLLYSLAWYLATPLVILHLLWRSRRQPEYRLHWRERWALPGAWPALEHLTPKNDQRPQGPVIWIHAVSVGETRAAQTLITALKQRDPYCRILLTAMTPTGRQASEQLYTEQVLRCYLPYDYPAAMQRFVDHWRPAVAIVMETELWPNLMAVCHARQVPVCLVNARLSQKSLDKGLRWQRLIRPAVRRLSAIAAQTEAHAARLRELGAERPSVTGNLKFDITPSNELITRGGGWRRAVGARGVVLAASTREGEERLLLDAWVAASEQKAAGADAGEPLLVIVPRHPQRFDEVAALARSLGLSVIRRSEYGTPQMLEQALVQAGGSAGTVLLGDSMGEMFAYYAMADVSILGGSLLEFGGQNLIESCAVGTPVVMGQHTYNFEEAAEQAIEHDAAIRVADCGDAVAAVIRLLHAPAQRARMADAASQFADRHRGATRKTMAVIEALLPAARG